MTTGADRAEAGLLATLVRGDELLSVHVTGERREALLALAERCDAEGWLVKTLSTPESILRDLQGPRRHWNARPHAVDVVVRPERIMLGVIGRLDLAADGPSR